VNTLGAPEKRTMRMRAMKTTILKREKHSRHGKQDEVEVGKKKAGEKTRGGLRGTGRGDSVKAERRREGEGRGENGE